MPRNAEVIRQWSILKELEASYRKREVASWGRLNWEFHRSLYVAAGRVKTLAILQGINLQTDRYVRLHLSLTGELDAAEKEHRQILRLCEQRDVEKAVSYVKKHIVNASRDLLEALWAAGAKVRAYDPVAMGEAGRLYGQRDDLALVEHAEAALEGADALVIVTEWQEFRSPDFDTIRDRLSHPVIFDGRNIYDPGLVKNFGLKYFGIGRTSA